MTLKVEQNPKKTMARDDTRRHGKAREDTTRHEKAREGTGTRARGTRAQNISYSLLYTIKSPDYSLSIDQRWLFNLFHRN